MFIHSRKSLENHTRVEAKMGKVYTRFQTKTAKKTPHPMGRNIPIWLIKAVPPGTVVFYNYAKRQLHTTSCHCFVDQKGFVS